MSFDDDSAVGHALARFHGEVIETLGRRLVSTLLYGSVVLDDLAPGYGDLDFLAVTSGDLSDSDIESLIAVRRCMREPGQGQLCGMLEGAFLPRQMLDPSRTGRALWWGTSGEREWNANRLGWLVIEFIRRRGVCVHGEDVRCELPAATPWDLREDIRAFCASAREHSSAAGLHRIDWLLTAARELLLLREDRFSSKSEAANWGETNARGEWRALLARASHLRRHPKQAGRPDVIQWLDSLGGPIEDAVRELEAEMGIAANR